MRVLVADDDPIVAQGFARRLETLGHTTVGPAYDGQEAIDLARSEPVDLYLFDIDMPTVDGVSAATTLTAEGLRRPVVLVTGVDDPEVIERSVAAGVAALLIKPIDDRQLNAAILLATARHAELCELEREVGRAEQALEDRKVLERAKGLLMESLGLSERESFERIRRNARNRNLTLAQVSAQVVEQHSILRGGD